MKITKRQLRRIIREAVATDRSYAADIAADFLANYPEISSVDMYYEYDADNQITDYARAYGVDPEDVKSFVMDKLEALET